MSSILSTSEHNLKMDNANYDEVLFERHNMRISGFKSDYLP